MKVLPQTTQAKEEGLSTRRELLEAICDCFSLSEAQVVYYLEGKEELAARALTVEPEIVSSEEEKLEGLLIKGGWLEAYAEFTRYNESPMSFHLACSIGVLGGAVGRECYIDRGVFKIYGSASVLLVGPTGKVKKSTAIDDVACRLVNEAAICPVLSGKYTAEYLGTTLKASSRAFLAASEMSFMFGRQKYNEGLVPLVLRLLDLPASIEIGTQARDKEIIENPTVSLMAGSTMSLLTSSTAEEVLSGGFLNRFLVVLENETERCFYRPRLGEGHDKLLSVLKRVHNYQGEIGLDSRADMVLEAAYRKRWKMIRAVSESEAAVMQRGDIHWLRVAMLVHLAECGLSPICEQCMSFAINFISFLEKRLPGMASAIDRTQVSQDNDYVMRTLLALGGAADHSTILRRVAARMNSKTFKSIVQNLDELGLIKISKKGTATYYIVVGEETS